MMDRSNPNAHDLALYRGLTERRMTRRDLLRHAGHGAGALSIAAFLAACGVGGTRRAEPTGGSATLPPKSGELFMANWIAYIDKDHGDSKTLNDFRAEFGIEMEYKEDVNDNDEFFGTDLLPFLSQGQSTGWDIVVLTDWMIAKMIKLGFVEELHHDRLPNVQTNLAEKYRDLYFDPGNAHSIPWAAGITGIGYNRALTGRDLTSIEDLFDPAFAGHIGMFLEMRDTFNFMFYLDGVDPPAATLEDVERGADRLRQQRDAGIVRGYYGNDYLDQLALGNVWATMAWSGDVFSLSLDSPDLQFVVPAEGGNSWTDNMCIPIHAENSTDAHLFMDYVYQPEVATRITEWVWYESPVAPVRDMIQEDAEAATDEYSRDLFTTLANSPLVWPDEDTASKIHGYKLLDTDEEEAWHEIFDPIAQG
jgi:spermidine/putrescine-binding protein